MAKKQKNSDDKGKKKLKLGKRGKKGNNDSDSYDGDPIYVDDSADYLLDGGSNGKKGKRRLV